MAHKAIGILLALVVCGVTAAVAEERQMDARKGNQATIQNTQKECRLDTYLSREGIKDVQARTCPLCEMMTQAPSPAAWILSMQKDLNLTSKQRDKLAELDKDFREDIADYDAKIMKSRAALNKVFQAEEFDVDDLEDALEDNANANIKAIIAWAEAKEDALDELTKEQRDRLMSKACMRAQRGTGAMGSERAESGKKPEMEPAETD